MSSTIEKDKQLQLSTEVAELRHDFDNIKSGKFEDAELSETLAEKLIRQHGKERALELVALNAGYREIPVGIDEFIESDDFMGKLTDNGKGIYPSWRRILRDIFPEDQKFGNPFKIVLFNTCIGSGKSNTARIAMTYCMHRFLCLENPHQYYHHQPTNDYVFAAWAPVAGTAADLLLGEMDQMMRISPWFKSKYDERGNFPSRIGLKFGSRHAAFVGRNVPMAIFTELAFEIIRGQAEENFHSIYKRVTSRFQKNGNIPFPVIVDCSITDDQSFVAKILEDYKNDRIYVVNGAIWDFKPRENYSAKIFKVFTGTDTVDPLVLEPIHDPWSDPDNCKIRENPLTESRIIDVPMDFLNDFRSDIHRSINDIAGVLTAGSSGFVTSSQTLSESMSRRNPVTRQIIRIGMDQSVYKDVHLIDYLDQEYLGQFRPNAHLDELEGEVDENTAFEMGMDPSMFPGSSFAMRQKKQQAEPDADRRPRSFHIDLGITGDLTGISSSLIEGNTTIQRTDPSSGKTVSFKEPEFLTEYTLYIGAAPSSEMPIYKVREFFVDLRLRGINVWKITLDGYQSTQIKQDLVLLGFDCVIISVDRTKEAYLAWKRAMMEGRWRSSNNVLLRDEFKCLRDTGKKIDHAALSDTESGRLVDSKDGADSVVGSIWNLFHGQDDTEVDEGDRDMAHDVLDAMVGGATSIDGSESELDLINFLMQHRR